MDAVEQELSTYKKVLGTPTRMSIFADDEESYLALRQSIINSPKESVDATKLPFDGVKLYTYSSYLMMQSVAEKQAAGDHVFHIREEVDGQVSTLAFGIYNSSNNLFTLLANSKLNRNSFVDSLMSLDSAISDFDSLLDGCYLRKELNCKSASIAASYALGRKSDFECWVGNGKKKLADFFDRFRLWDIHSLEESLYPKEKQNNEVLIKEDVPDFSVLLGKKIIAPLLDYIYSKSDVSEVIQPTTHHIFLLEKLHRCKAQGYFDEDSNRFVILKGSMFSKTVDPKYKTAGSFETRSRMILSVCADKGNYYVVNEDFTCRSATTAASILLGESSHYSFWADKDGLLLKHFYPNRYSVETVATPKTKATEVVVTPQPSIFTLYMEGKTNGSVFSAKAKFYKNTNRFILLAGSILSFEVTSKYRFTSEEFSRRLFLKSLCKLEGRTYKLKADESIQSAKLAANYVAGDMVDGNVVWKDKNGVTLKDLIN